MYDVERLLEHAGARETGSRNRLALSDVKAWLADYLAMREEEETRFADKKSSNHWDMIVADYDSTRNAQFLAAYFSGEQVTFLAGVGELRAVRSFAKNDFPMDADDVLPSLSRRFSAGEQWTVSLGQVIRWTRT